MEFIDTHAHLSDGRFSLDRDATLQRAAAAGISRIIEIADAPSEWDAAIALARAHPRHLRCSLGLHPYYADKLTEELSMDLKKEAHRPEVVAIGEIGLDYVKSSISRERQLETFETLLAVARSLEKPAVIHCRGAYAELRLVIEKIFPQPPKAFRYWGVAHCFSGSVEDAMFLAGRGFVLGVDGPVTYPKNGPLREALRKAGLSSLVLETDSPYLPPQSARGSRNEPATIPEIAKSLAQTLDVPLEEVAIQTTENALALYRIEK